MKPSALDPPWATPALTTGRGWPRYTVLRITLHWTLASLIFYQLWLGWRMTHRASGYEMLADYQRHFEVGGIILLLTFVRVAVRVAEPEPPYTAVEKREPQWQYRLASLAHLAFYALLLGLPITGLMILAATSGQPAEPLYGFLRLPPVPGLHTLDVTERGEVGEVFEWLHFAFVCLLILTMFGHVGAALKHHFLDHDGVLIRMIPALRHPPGRDRPD